jgi:hypothetical protein
VTAIPADLLTRLQALLIIWDEQAARPPGSWNDLKFYLRGILHRRNVGL